MWRSLAPAGHPAADAVGGWQPFLQRTLWQKGARWDLGIEGRLWVQPASERHRCNPVSHYCGHGPVTEQRDKR